MQRTILTMAGVFSASGLLMVDSTIKGSMLLLLAGIAALLLRRDSAATRHLVWMLAIVAMLFVPVLSATLPQWRVLPDWVGISPQKPVMPAVVAMVPIPASDIVEAPTAVVPDIEMPSAMGHQPARGTPAERIVIQPEVRPPVAATSSPWFQSLSIVWAIGCCGLCLRLLAARVMLWNGERHAVVICTWNRRVSETRDPLAVALDAACQQLGIRRSVTLLIHSEKTIPIVWGLLRHRLLLPVAARDWSDEQLRSVLLHELAHIKRRDVAVQLLSQLACALHWFNPLVWLADWRLSVERERACDDLVLASGVRPSAYAGHLLQVVTDLSPVRWTQSCGLAMARRSSIESRLVAVLSGNLNRRSVSVVLAGLAILIGIGIAIPIAMLRAADEKPQETKNDTAEEDAAVKVQPQHADDLKLFQKWQSNARADGTIPGGMLGSLARVVANFVKLNPTHEKAPALAQFQKRIDTSHDWTPVDAAKLLDDLSAIYPGLSDWTEFEVRLTTGSPIQTRQPLPAELADVAWGEAAANGLRAGWRLSPSRNQYPFGTNLRSFVVFQNTGKETIVFRTPEWHQESSHQARDANGAVINVNSTEWTTLISLVTIRLAPGEYAELGAHGIGIGARSDEHDDDWSNLRVGAWIEAKAGDQVVFQPGPLMANELLWTPPENRRTPADMWKAIIKQRIDRAAPMPAAAVDRESLVRQVTLDLLGVTPTAAEIKAFVTDNSADALDVLANRLAPRAVPFAGALPVGEIKFRVTAADPDAAKRPRVVTGPGRYNLGKNAGLVVVQKHEGDRRVNEATIQFYSAGPNEALGKPQTIQLPDGEQTWAAAWERNSTVLWVAQAGLLRKYDFTNPADVQETRIEATRIAGLPESIQAVLKGAPVGLDTPKPQNNGAKLDPAMLEGIWTGQKDGVEVDVRFIWEAEHQEVQWSVRQSGSTIGAQMSIVMIKDGTTASLVFRKGLEFEATQGLLTAGDNGTLRLVVIPNPNVRNPGYPVLQDLVLKRQPGHARLVPKHAAARTLLAKWQLNARADGKIPGALLGHVATAIDNFLKGYPQEREAASLARLRPRFDASRDWSPEDVVALLDEVAAISTAPLSWAGSPLELDSQGQVKAGKPLPADLQNAAWGKPIDNGLRAAWLLEPRAEQYPLGSILKGRVLFHNSGKVPVVFSTETWHQNDLHTARDESLDECKISSTWYTGITPVVTHRLAPGEYCEVQGHGIAVGAGSYVEELSTGSVGAVIEAKAGTKVILTHSVETVDGISLWPDPPKDQAGRWNRHIAERLAREAPLPTSRADREKLIRRVTLDLFGEPATPDEVDSFVSDTALEALVNLTKRLQAKPHSEPFIGRLPTGTTTFQVIAADPDAAKKPRVATRPGRYVLGKDIHLLISQLTERERRSNKAVIAFLSQDPLVSSPHEPFEIELPDGEESYGIAWERDSGMVWIAQKGLLRKIDFTNPAKVQQTRFMPGRLEDLPANLRGSLRSMIAVADPQGTQHHDSPKSERVVKLDPDRVAQLKWGEAVNGLRAAVIFRYASKAPTPAELPELQIAVQNVSKRPIRLNDTLAQQQPRMLYIKVDGETVAGIGAKEPRLGDVTLQADEVAFILMYAAEPLSKEGHSTGAVIAEGVLKDTHQSLVAHLQIEKAPAGAWTGALVSGETNGSVAVGQPQPNSKDGKSLYRVWQHNARKNGNIPGGFIGRLQEKVNQFIRVNSKDAAGAPYAMKMEPLVPRFDASRDWTLADVVSLLDDIAAVSSAPLSMAVDEAAAITVTRGDQLPADLANAPWGPPNSKGLRLAWLLEPDAKEHRLGTPLKIRLLVHNPGANVVVFRTRMWHQPGLKARDGNGVEIPLESVSHLTRGRLTPIRLWPGEFIELRSPAVGVGSRKNAVDWENLGIGSWIEAKVGDDVTVAAGSVPLHDWNETADSDSQWWFDLIKARLARELPLPTNVEERKHLVYRAGMDCFGTPVSSEEIAVFVADTKPNALDSLAQRFAQHPRTIPVGGSLVSGPTTFRVLPADPDAAKKPRTASNPGRYTLGDSAVLAVTRRPDGERIVNEASIQFSSTEIGKPWEVKLADGYDTWSAAWVRNSGVLWVRQPGSIRQIDFTNPQQVKETILDEATVADQIPKTILDALRSTKEPAPPRRRGLSGTAPATDR